MSNADSVLYCQQMEEIIRRDGLVRQLMAGKVTLGSEYFDYEVFALNMRKTLELIAFSSLIACKEKYASEHKKFDRHYKAKDILEAVAAINPKFFPVPAKLNDEQPDGVRNLSLSDSAPNALTRDEFVELYDKCSTVLHAWKPYNPSPKQVDFRLSPIEWTDKIRDLLNMHYVYLPEEKGFWLCMMRGTSDKPHVYHLAPKE